MKVSCSKISLSIPNWINNGTKKGYPFEKAVLKLLNSVVLADQVSYPSHIWLQAIFVYLHICSKKKMSSGFLKNFTVWRIHNFIFKKCGKKFNIMLRIIISSTKIVSLREIKFFPTIFFLIIFPLQQVLHYFGEGKKSN